MSVLNARTEVSFAISRRGPIEVPTEKKCDGRSAHPNFGSGTDYQTRPSSCAQANCVVSRVAEKTRGEIEASIGQGISLIQQEYFGRGPRQIDTHLIEDLLLVRLFGVLTVAERQLIDKLNERQGRELVKQVRIQLIETARPVMETMVKNETGVQVISLHHDLSTVTGEELIAFTLSMAPICRESTKKRR